MKQNTDYTTTEAALRLNVSKRTLTRWLNQGLFPHAYKNRPNSTNSPFRIPAADIEAFEAARHTK